MIAYETTTALKAITPTAGTSAVALDTRLTWTYLSDGWVATTEMLGELVQIAAVDGDVTAFKARTITSGVAGDWYTYYSGKHAALSDLTDINVTTKANGQVLTYDTSTSKWIPSTASSWIYRSSVCGQLPTFTTTNISNLHIKLIGYSIASPTALTITAGDVQQFSYSVSSGDYFQLDLFMGDSITQAYSIVNGGTPSLFVTTCNFAASLNWAIAITNGKINYSEIV